MKRMTAWLMPAFALLCIGTLHAAEKDQANVVRDYTDTVAPADQEAYEAGIKNYNACLTQHGSKATWVAWTHETGDVYSYSYVTDPLAWADFDTMRDASKPCDATFRAQVNPHLKGESSAFMKGDPDLGNMPTKALGRPALIEVTYFKLKPGKHKAFVDAAKKVYAALRKKQWPGHSMIYETVDGGSDAPDFLMVSPSKNWADLGKELDPTVWEVVEDVYGKADGDAIHDAVRDAIKDSSSHIDRYNAELTYTAAGK